MDGAALLAAPSLKVGSGLLLDWPYVFSRSSFIQSSTLLPARARPTDTGSIRLMIRDSVPPPFFNHTVLSGTTCVCIRVSECMYVSAGEGGRALLHQSFISSKIFSLCHQ